METLTEIFGRGKELGIFQMSMRTVLIFLITLLFIRISGKRAFGMHMPVDNVMTILLGALLSRAIVGASPFIATVISGFVLVVLYRICTGMGVFSKLFGKIVKGSSILIYQNGKMIKENMVTAMVTEEDLMEEMRVNSNLGSLEDVETAHVERNGEISIVKKKEV
ncbi:MAG TPA: YetF domain-containing protein [Bacteroidia bacterium]|nr:YetF domain-containing protein [Bacteroidia bacterium]